LFQKHSVGRVGGARPPYRDLQAKKNPYKVVSIRPSKSIQGYSTTDFTGSKMKVSGRTFFPSKMEKGCIQIASCNINKILKEKGCNR
jgi:hypothetical protein